MIKKRKFDNRGGFAGGTAITGIGQDEKKFRTMRTKKWRLIIRNLPFTCKREDIEAAFSRFGIIEEIVLPPSKKDPSTGAGFAFVQFRKEEQATEAMKSMNENEIAGRPVAVDWAVPKDQYMTAVLEGNEREVYERNKEPSPRPIAKRPSPMVHRSAPSTLDKKSKRQRENTPGTSDSAGDDTEGDDASSENEGKKKPVRKDAPETKLQSDEPDDGVKEGRTLFIRNIPFDVTDDDLREVFMKFGQVKYCVVCKYPGTDHSKGSGFVQFVEKESADKCLEKANEISSGVKISGQLLSLCPAISKGSARQMEKQKHEHKPKDNRNLHLLRIGLIRAGTSESNGMSATDTAKRMRIEAANRTKIKQFNIFVSPTRMCIHNIPSTVDDKQLKGICMKAVDEENARIRECRIMRDLNRPNSQGVGKSRGYAFVDFTEHDHAMKCLKTMNNNPDIFSNEKRPIVEFSLENRAAVMAKMKRAERAKMNANEMQEKSTSSEVSFTDRNTKKQGRKGNEKVKFATPTSKSTSGAKVQISKKPFPSHFGPKIRHRKRTPQKATSKSTAGDGGNKKKAGKEKRKEGKNQSSSAVQKKSNPVLPKQSKKLKKKRGVDEGGKELKRRRWFET